MELSPIDVQQKTFRAALRGYAEDEVDDFLDQVVETLRGYEQRVQEAEERAVALEEELSATKETEEAIKRTFIAAQRTRDEMIEEARTETTRMLAQAREEAEQQLVDARLRAVRAEEEHVRERDQLIRELTQLRSVVGELRERFQSLATGAFEEFRWMETSIEESGIPLLEQPGPEEPEARQAEHEEAAASPDEEQEEDEESRPKAAEEEAREASLTGQFGQAAYLRRPRARRPWERDEE
jgi:cell division initiation protein